MLHRNASQSSSDRCRTSPKYFNESTPSKIFARSSPVRLKVSPVQFSAVSTSCLCNLICVFQSHLSVRRCLMSRPASMCIPHMSQRGSSSIPSWVIAIQDRKFRNMKCSCSLPALYDTAGQPSTGHLTNWRTLGKDITYLDSPSPLSSTPLVWGTQIPCCLEMCFLRYNCVTVTPHSGKLTRNLF